MEKIVFNQHELDAAVGTVCSIALCDNDYIILPSANTKYTAIGSVSATVRCPAVHAISMGMTFIGFIPEFDDSAAAPEEPKTETKPVSSFASSFASSFRSSLAGSFSTSYSGSFSGRYEYEYEYRSFRKGSFSGSFSGSSFRMKSSFVTGSMGIIKSRKKYVIREISVNGYGLNLI